MPIRSPWLATVLLSTACMTAPAPKPAAPTPEPATPEPTPSRPVGPPAKAVGHAATGLPLRHLLFAEPERHTVKISPDGKHIAWLDGKSGAVTLWLADTHNVGKPRQVAGDKARPVFDYHWAYTNEHLVYLQDDLGDKNYHLYTLEIDTGKSFDMTTFVNTAVRFVTSTPKWPTTVVVAMNDRDEDEFDIFHLDIATGERAQLGKNTIGLGDFRADHELRLRYGQMTMPDGSIEVYMPSKGHQTWGKVDSIPPGDVFTTRFLGFNKTNDKQYVIDSRGRQSAVLIEMDTQTRAKKVLAEDAGADVTELLVHPGEQTVQAAGVARERSRWIVLDQSIAADLAALDKLDHGDYSVVSRTLDDKLWVVAFRSDRRPPRYHLWDRTSKTDRFLFAAHDELDKQPLARLHPFRFSARDGLELVGYYTLPRDKDQNGRTAAPLPTVLLVHDGPWARDSYGYQPMHQFLASRGYAVLSIEYRGSTGLGKKVLDAGNGEWGKKMQSDLADGVAWGVKAGFVDAGKVCIVGSGYGGYAALAGLALTPDAYTCGVSIAGPARLTTLGEIVWRGSSAASAIYKLRMGDHTSFDGKKALEAVSPINHAAAIRRPLLLVGALKDERSPASENEFIVKTVKGNGVPVTYARFPDEAGPPARFANKMALYAVLEAFLSAHLGGSYATFAAEGAPGSSLEIFGGTEGIPGMNEQ